jgi:hypothetical protein
MLVLSGVLFVSTEQFKRQLIEQEQRDVDNTTALTAAQIDDVKSQLEEMGLEVSIQKVTPQFVPIDPILARIVVTPIALLGTLLVVWFVYGTEPFLSNSVVVPTIVLIGYGLYGAIWRYRLRHSDSENGQDSY